MAKVSLEMVKVLRNAAQKIESSAEYQWGHMGACNCGFVAQEVTRFSKSEIHQRAMMSYGDWSEQLNDYCATSGLPMDDVIGQLLRFGFQVEELKHLERLSDPRVLQCLPLCERNVKHNVKADVVTYLRTWADLLEASLLNTISPPDLRHQSRYNRKMMQSFG